jgi:exocyst complex component 8
MADLAKRAGIEGSLDGTANSGAKEKVERDARWVSDFCDELNVAVALREFEQAVKLVEEGTLDILGLCTESYVDLCSHR